MSTVCRPATFCMSNHWSTSIGSIKIWQLFHGTMLFWIGYGVVGFHLQCISVFGSRSYVLHPPRYVYCSKYTTSGILKEILKEIYVCVSYVFVYSCLRIVLQLKYLTKYVWVIVDWFVVMFFYILSLHIPMVLHPILRDYSPPSRRSTCSLMVHPYCFHRSYWT